MIVVGAGAAGHAAALAAAQAGAAVVLLEQLPQPGRKLLASGGGRCNLTNLASPQEVALAFGRQGRFVLPALEAMEPEGLVGWMRRLGLATEAEKDGRVFPAARKAADVLAALQRRLKELGVETRCACAVERLWIEEGVLRGVEQAGGRRVGGKGVVLACGGRSWPKLGGTGGGYALAEQAGHEITPLTPALVPLVTQQRWPGRLAGISVAGARVSLIGKGQSKAGRIGDVLFTHRGLSGPAILDLSGDAAECLACGREVVLKVEFLAGQEASSWKRRFEEWRATEGRRSLGKLLSRYLPVRLAETLCEQADVCPQTPAAELTAAGRDRLAAMLGGTELTVIDTEGWPAAFVTRGGVALRGVDPRTLQSRILPGLFFAGEILDLDGPTGGYNLRWAFSSGRLAGQSAAGFVRRT